MKSIRSLGFILIDALVDMLDDLSLFQYLLSANYGTLMCSVCSVWFERHANLYQHMQIVSASPLKDQSPIGFI